MLNALALPDLNLLLISKECSDPRSVMLNFSEPLVPERGAPVFHQEQVPESPADRS